MAGTIESYQTAQGRRYRVRYRKPDKSQTDKRGFKTKREAELYLASVTLTKATGDYIDPALARVTVDQLSTRWLSTKKAMKPSAYKELPRTYANHVKPRWGDREVGGIVPSEIIDWVVNLTVARGEERPASASVKLRALGVLAGILDMAVDDRRISRNPARKLKGLPRKPKKKPGRVYLSHDQLQRLAAASKHPELVLLLGYTGLRWGEAAGLRVRHVNILRRRVHVEENAVQVDGIIEIGTPKSREHRTVPIPAFLAPLLERVAAGKGPNGILFGDGVNHLHPPRFGNGWFEGAIDRVQETDEDFPRITPHDLRHTAASLAVQAGANVKALQRMLGHESAALTLDTYADLFDDDLDSVAVHLEEAARAQSVGKTWASLLA